MWVCIPTCEPGVRQSKRQNEKGDTHILFSHGCWEILQFLKTLPFVEVVTQASVPQDH